MEATSGFEPLNRGFADPRLNHLATSPRSKKNGAEDEIRTRDFLLGKEAFYRWTTSACFGAGGEIWTPMNLRSLAPQASASTSFRHPGELSSWQEWQESNPRPAVLETAALPNWATLLSASFFHQHKNYIEYLSKVQCMLPANIEGKRKELEI